MSVNRVNKLFKNHFVCSACLSCILWINIFVDDVDCDIRVEHESIGTMKKKKKRRELNIEMKGEKEALFHVHCLTHAIVRT